MNTILLITDAELGLLLLRFGAAVVLFVLSLSLTTILWALRAAPEGYEDADGFHFTQSSPSISRPVEIAILRPRHAG